MTIVFIIPVAVFFAVMLLSIGLFIIIQNKQAQKSQAARVEKVVNLESQSYVQTTQSADFKEGDSLRRDTRISSIKWLDTLLAKILKEHTKSLVNLIEQTGLRIKVSEFVLFVGLTTLMGEMLIDIFFHVPLVGVIAGIIPFLLMNFLKAQRTEAFIKQLPQALDLLSGDLRAGLDIQTGLKHLSEEFIPPLGEEFAKVVVEVNLGITLPEALNNLSRRMNTMDVQMLCTGIIINRELGGNLSELIQSIAETVRERFRLKGMIKALTAENQMSAYLLIALPIGLFFLLNIMSPDIYSKLLTDPTGRMILMGCIVSMTIGYLMMRKMTKVDV